MLAALLAACCSCNTTKYLEPGEELLVSQRVRLGGGRAVDNRADEVYELEYLTKQKPNTNFLLLFPREYFYLANDKPRDTTAVDDFLRNTIGQPPAIYSDSLSRVSAASMADYLRYEGYFNATAYHEAVRRKDRKVNLIYHVEPGRRYRIDSIEVNATDPRIDSIIQANRAGSLLRVGDPLDLNVFDQEKQRLSNLLRNNGYAFFSGNYFDQLEVDTTRRPGGADIFLNVLPPQREDAYRRYRVGKVTVITDYAAGPGFSTGFTRDTVIQGIRIIAGNDAFELRPGILARNVYLKPGQLYRREDFERTNLGLGALGVYRFVRINQNIDTTRDGVLNYIIQLTNDNKMAFSVDLDLNYTNRQGGINNINNLVGTSISPSFQNRNTFGGAELLTLTARAGVEVNPALNSNRPAFFNTVDLGADAQLNVPRFRDFGPYRWLRGLGVLQRDFYGEIRRRATTRYSASYEYVLLRGFYDYTLANAQFGYNFQRSATTGYRITHTSVDILNPSTQEAFDDILDTNPFLRLSFGDQYFVSGLFRNLTYTRLGRPDRRGRTVNFNGQFETAGGEVALLNRLVNTAFGSEDTWRPRDSAIYAKYYLAIGDVGYRKNFTPTRALAARFLFGFGRPFGGQATLPYVKQFFAGGANSMRAWQPRALGPGGYVDPLSLDTDNNLFLFQTGDLRLEFNAEYRFKLFSVFRGAFFTDIGNVWTVEEDPARPGAQFSLKKRTVDPEGENLVLQPFYRQLAIGSGLGLRVDLSYFIFRLDAAIPLRYNYPQDGDGNPLDRSGLEFSAANYWRSFDTFSLGDVTFQLGLGYPF